MAYAAHEDSVLPRPVQEEAEQGDQKITAATVVKMLRYLQQLNPDEIPDLLGVDGMKSNPDVLNQVQSLGTETTGSKLRAMASSLSAAASFIARFVFALLFNTLFGEPRDQHAQVLDEIKSGLEEVKTKQEKVQHDTRKMEEKIQTAIKNNLKISCNESKELEIKLVTARCDLDSCQDILSCVRDATDGLQLKAKQAIASVHKLLAIAITLVFVAASAAGFLHHLGGLAKSEGYDDDEDVEGKGSMSYSMVMSYLIMTVIPIAFCTVKARSWISNQKLLAECQVLQKTGLQKAERFQKDLHRDVAYRLPQWKKQLTVLDIDVSLYASLHDHSE